FAEAGLVLALGPRMLERLRQYVTAGTRLEWVPLWGTAGNTLADTVQIGAQRQRRGWTSHDCVLLYSGNMGLGHRLEDFLGGATQMGAGDTVWAFTGGGRRLAEVRSCAKANPTARIEVLPYVPYAELSASLGAADVHLVSLRSGWEGLILPSKLQAAFAS